MIGHLQYVYLPPSSNTVAMARQEVCVPSLSPSGMSSGNAAAIGKL